MLPGLPYILIYSSEYALIAAGFSLVYRTGRAFHFALGAIIATGAYSLFALAVRASLPFSLAVPLAVAIASSVGLLIEVVVYAPIRRRWSAPLTLLVGSLGVYAVLQNLIAATFGDDTKQVISGVVRGVSFFGVSLTTIQLAIPAAGMLLLACLAMLMGMTRIGKSMKAVADDTELATACGIRTERAALWASGIAGALGGSVGVLLALDVDATPTMGMKPLMVGLVAAIVGGLGSIPGMILGALMLGLAQYACIATIGSRWQDAGAFAILLIFLLFRPYGIFGRKLRKAEI